MRVPIGISWLIAAYQKAHPPRNHRRSAEAQANLPHPFIPSLGRREPNGRLMLRSTGAERGGNDLVVREEISQAVDLESGNGVLP